MKSGMQRARESLIRSLIQGNVFHIPNLGLVAEKAIRVFCWVQSKFQSSVIGDTVILGHYPELREGGLRVVFISL